MSLKQLIQRKISDANLNPGKTVKSKDLKGGLNIAIRLDGNIYTVHLSRKGLTPPSDTEISTFLNHWPQYTPITQNERAGVTFEIPRWRKQ